MKLNTNLISALRTQKHDEFIEQMVAFFKQRDAFHAEALGDGGLRAAVAFGLEQARADGITQRDPVRVYLQLMFFLGGRFAHDPLMSWTRPILDADTPYRTQAARMEALRRAAIEHLRLTCGADGAPLRAFMAQCLALSDAGQTSKTGLETQQFLAQAYPLKFDHLGETAVAGLIADSAQSCGAAGLKHPASAFYFTCLRFVYGTGAAEDPLLPWIHKLFWKTEARADKDALFERLTLKFLENVTAHIAKREVKDVG